MSLMGITDDAGQPECAEALRKVEHVYVSRAMGHDGRDTDRH